MEQEPWRRCLDDLVRRRSSEEKSQLYQQVGVTRTTVQRWRNGDNIPDPPHIHRLLQALLDTERNQLRLLMQQDPQLRMPAASQLAGESDRIPQQVYEEVLRIGRDAPDRFWRVV
jgi:transcriptional regulator with XRE-family HTH domain